MRKLHIKNKYPVEVLSTISDVSTELAQTIERDLTNGLAEIMRKDNFLTVKRSEINNDQIIEATCYVMSEDRYKLVKEAFNRISSKINRLTLDQELFRAFYELSDSLFMSSLSKAEAIRAAQAGNKVRHESFSPEEWFTMSDHTIILEDGVKCSVLEFFLHRPGKSWDNGYEIVK